LRTLLRLYKTGVSKLFETMIGEFHLSALPQELEEIDYITMRSLRRLSRTLKQKGFRDFVDESYPHDGME
jgi:hypothetical protein